VTAPEPLTLTELVRRLGEYEYWLGYDLSGMYAGMYVVMPMDEDSPARCGTGSTPWEAANDAMPKRRVAPRDEAAELRAAIGERSEALARLSRAERHLHALAASGGGQP